jgi:hypothetical protein
LPLILLRGFPKPSTSPWDTFADEIISAHASDQIGTPLAADAMLRPKNRRHIKT